MLTIELARRTPLPSCSAEGKYCRSSFGGESAGEHDTIVSAADSPSVARNARRVTFESLLDGRLRENRLRHPVGEQGLCLFAADGLP